MWFSANSQVPWQRFAAAVGFPAEAGTPEGMRELLGEDVTAYPATALEESKAGPRPVRYIRDAFGAVVTLGIEYLAFGFDDRAAQSPETITTPGLAYQRSDIGDGVWARADSPPGTVSVMADGHSLVGREHTRPGRWRPMFACTDPRGLVEIDEEDHAYALAEGKEPPYTLHLTLLFAEDCSVGDAEDFHGMWSTINGRFGARHAMEMLTRCYVGDDVCVAMIQTATQTINVLGGGRFWRAVVELVDGTLVNACLPDREGGYEHGMSVAGPAVLTGFVDQHEVQGIVLEDGVGVHRHQGREAHVHEGEDVTHVHCEPGDCLGLHFEDTVRALEGLSSGWSEATWRTEACWPDGIVRDPERAEPDTILMKVSPVDGIGMAVSAATGRWSGFVQLGMPSVTCDIHIAAASATITDGQTDGEWMSRFREYPAAPGLGMRHPYESRVSRLLNLKPPANPDQLRLFENAEYPELVPARTAYGTWTYFRVRVDSWRVIRPELLSGLGDIPRSHRLHPPGNHTTAVVEGTMYQEKVVVYLPGRAAASLEEGSIIYGRGQICGITGDAVPWPGHNVPEDVLLRDPHVVRNDTPGMPEVRHPDIAHLHRIDGSHGAARTAEELGVSSALITSLFIEADAAGTAEQRLRSHVLPGTPGQAPDVLYPLPSLPLDSNLALTVRGALVESVGRLSSGPVAAARRRALGIMEELLPPDILELAESSDRWHAGADGCTEVGFGDDALDALYRPANLGWRPDPGHWAALGPELLAMAPAADAGLESVDGDEDRADMDADWDDEWDEDRADDYIRRERAIGGVCHWSCMPDDEAEWIFAGLEVTDTPVPVVRFVRDCSTGAVWPVVAGIATGAPWQFDRRADGAERAAYTGPGLSHDDALRRNYRDWNPVTRAWPATGPNAGESVCAVVRAGDVTAGRGRYWAVAGDDPDDPLNLDESGYLYPGGRVLVWGTVTDRIAGAPGLVQVDWAGGTWALFDVDADDFEAPEVGEAVSVIAELIVGPPVWA